MGWIRLGEWISWEQFDFFGVDVSNLEKRVRYILERRKELFMIFIKSFAVLGFMCLVLVSVRTTGISLVTDFSLVVKLEPDSIMLFSTLDSLELKDLTDFYF